MPYLARPYRALCLSACAAILSLAVAPGLASAQAMTNGHPLRTISGVVTSPGHEPLKGAIVELQQGDSPTITSYITGADGRYAFKRLDSEMDYRVWVIFRKRHSKTHEISKFDDHTDKVIDFSIETF